MVKYGKIYRKIQTAEWKKYYLDYKLLKKKIKEIKEKLGDSIKTSIRESKASLLSSPLVPNEDIENDENEIYKEENGKYLKEFIDLLLKEFQKSFNFYVRIERVLVKKMNAHLCTQTSYSTYDLQELSKEMKSLTLTVFLTKSLNDFANDIMTALKKILKKFDKNFYKIYGIITPLFILKLLSKKNSPLDYMQQFKVIDEIGVIAESSAKELKKYFDQNTEENNLENLEYRNTLITLPANSYYVVSAMASGSIPETIVLSHQSGYATSNVCSNVNYGDSYDISCTVSGFTGESQKVYYLWSKHSSNSNGTVNIRGFYFQKQS